jgi:hypothetical protein
MVKYSLTCLNIINYLSAYEFAFFLMVNEQRASGLSHRIISHTTMCFSNLVGPLEEIGFYGHPMTYLAPSSYGQPHVSNFVSINQKNDKHC